MLLIHALPPPHTRHVHAHVTTSSTLQTSSCKVSTPYCKLSGAALNACIVTSAVLDRGSYEPWSRRRSLQFPLSKRWSSSAAASLSTATYRRPELAAMLSTATADEDGNEDEDGREDAQSFHRVLWGQQSHAAARIRLSPQVPRDLRCAKLLSTLCHGWPRPTFSYGWGWRWWWRGRPPRPQKEHGDTSSTALAATSRRSATPDKRALCLTCVPRARMSARHFLQGSLHSRPRLRLTTPAPGLHMHDARASPQLAPA